MAELELEGVFIFGAQIFFGQARELLYPVARIQYARWNALAAAREKRLHGGGVVAPPSATGYGTGTESSGAACSSEGGKGGGAEEGGAGAQAAARAEAHAEAQLGLAEYDGVFDEYLELVVQVAEHLGLQSEYIGLQSPSPSPPPRRQP